MSCSQTAMEMTRVVFPPPLSTASGRDSTTCQPSCLSRAPLAGRGKASPCPPNHNKGAAKPRPYQKWSPQSGVTAPSQPYSSQPAPFAPCTPYSALCNLSCPAPTFPLANHTLVTLSPRGLHPRSPLHCPLHLPSPQLLPNPSVIYITPLPHPLSPIS